MMEVARSGVIHLPDSTSIQTDIVSNTKSRVSSEVTSMKGPKSFAIRGANSVKTEPSKFWTKLESIQKWHMPESNKDILLYRFDRGDLDRDTGITGLNHSQGRI